MPPTRPWEPCLTDPEGEVREADMASIGAGNGRAARCRAKGAMAILAIGVLLAGCSGAAAEGPSEQSGAGTPAPRGGQVVGLPVALPSAPGIDGAGPGPTATRSDDAAGGSAAAVVHVPEGWAGTISVDTLPESREAAYLVLQQLDGELTAASELRPEELLRTEFLAAQSARCDGAATLDGGVATCMLQADVDGGSSGPRAPASVRLVPAASGASALLISVGDGGADALSLASGTALALRTVDGTTPAEMTPRALEGAVVEAVAAGDPSGALPAEAWALCTLLDEGRHAMCEVGGVGGGDGLWYATVQPGLERIPGGGTTYLFSQLPS